MKIIERIEDHHIIFYDGITIDKEISVFTKDGIFDLTGFEATLTARTTREETANQILFTSETTTESSIVTGNIAINIDNGTLTLNLNKEQANNFSNATVEGVFDLTAISSTEKILIMRGTYEIESVI